MLAVCGNGTVEKSIVRFLVVGAENAKQDSWIGAKMRCQVKRYWIRFMCEESK